MAADNALLALLQAGLTPPQIAALQGIANLRNAGFQDPEIYGMPSETVQGYASGQAPLRLGVGSAYLPTAADLARTTSSDRLGRGNIALGMAQFQQNRAVDDATMGRFNIAQYLDYLARTGASLPLGNPVLDRLKPVFPTRTATMPEQYLEDFLSYPREEPGDIGILRKQRAALGDERFMAGMRNFAALDQGAHARGGSVVSDEPMVGIGVWSGQPRFMLGEEGAERMDITPLRARGRNRDAIRRRQPPTAAPNYVHEVTQMAGGGSATVRARDKGLATLGIAAKAAIAKKAAARPGRLGTAAGQDAKATALAGVDPNTNMGGSGYYDPATNTRYTGGGTGVDTAGEQADMYRRSSYQTRKTADPIKTHRDSSGMTSSGGEYLTPEERAAAQADQQRRVSRKPLGVAQDQRPRNPANEPNGQGSAPGTAPGGDDSYESAAKLVGEAMQSTAAIVPPEFLDALIRGEVPGISQLTRRQYRELLPNVRRSLIDLWMNSGLVASEDEIEETFSKYAPGE